MIINVLIRTIIYISNLYIEIFIHIAFLFKIPSKLKNIIKLRKQEETGNLKSEWELPTAHCAMSQNFPCDAEIFKYSLKYNGMFVW